MGVLLTLDSPRLSELSFLVCLSSLLKNVGVKRTPPDLSPVSLPSHRPNPRVGLFLSKNSQDSWPAVPRATCLYYS